VSTRRSDAERRHDVDPLGVEIAFIDDARDDDQGAESERQERPPAHSSPFGYEREDDDRNQRRREVRRHEDAAQPASEAAPAHVVELVRLDPGVRDDHDQRDEPEERPERVGLAETRSCGSLAKLTVSRA
jgi:hypothetical protein